MNINKVIQENEQAKVQRMKQRQKEQEEENEAIKRYNQYLGN